MKEHPKAFPRNQWAGGPKSSDHVNEPGMDLRDYFAAKAMQGLLSNPSVLSTLISDPIDWVTREAFKVADIMMEERHRTR